LMESGFLSRPRNELDPGNLQHCEHLDVALRSLHTTMLVMLEVTFDGAGYWTCYYYSSSPIAGVSLHATFMMFVLVVLVNTLIAMMADTYNRVQVLSFANYVFEFSKILMEWRDNNPSPFNLLTYPWHITQLVLSITSHASLVLTVAQYLSLAQEAPTESGVERRYTVLKIARQVTRQVLPPMSEKKKVLFQNGMKSVHLKHHNRSHPTKDVRLMQEIHTIKRNILTSKAKMLHFRKAISRYCRAQEDTDEWTEPLTDKVREIVSEMADELRANMKTDMQAMLTGREGGNTVDQSAERPVDQSADADADARAVGGAPSA